MIAIFLVVKLKTNLISSQYKNQFARRKYKNVKEKKGDSDSKGSVIVCVISIFIAILQYCEKQYILFCGDD